MKKLLFGGGVLLASSLFAETSSEVQVGVAYEPSCTIEIPSVVSFNLSGVNSVGGDSFGVKQSRGLSGNSYTEEDIHFQVNCAKDLTVNFEMSADDANGNWVGTEGSYIKEWGTQGVLRDHSGIFPITNTLDPNDDGAYSIGILPKFIANSSSNQIYVNYSANDFTPLIGIGDIQNLFLRLNTASHNCPLIPNTDKTNCPAGDIDGSVTVSLSW